MSEDNSRLIVRNLPKNVDEVSLKKLFDPFGTVTDCRIIFAGEKNRRFGFVGYAVASSAEKALQSLNRSYLGGSKLLVGVSTPRESTRNPQTTAKEGELDPLRLYITNLPFGVDEGTVEEELRRSGKLGGFRLLKTRDGGSQGRGFCSYENESETLSHLSALDGRVFLGRILRAERCLKFSGQSAHAAQLQAAVQAEPSALKKLSKQKLLNRIEKPSTWGAMFLNPNVVLERVAAKLNTTRKAMLAEGVQFAAVVQTLAEKEVLQETQDFLRANGVEPELFTADPLHTPRSSTVIMVKNLPLDATHQEVEGLFRRHGQVSRTLLAPNKTVAIVWYNRADHAQNAFGLLGIYKMRGSPLYLEWAPARLLADGEGDLLAKRARDEPGAATPVLVLKNLTFEVGEGELEDVLRARGVREWRSVTIPQRNGKSVGYGFVEFGSESEAAKAQLALHGELLRGRVLEPLFSRSARSAPAEKREGGAADASSQKLMIKNLAFNANKKELSELIAALVGLRKVRMPQKADNSSRGYAFVEFDSAEECQSAFRELQNLHFYGRRLVVEFAQA